MLKLAGVSSSSIAIVLIVYRILKSIQGKKLVSSCCGKKMEVGIDVAPMTPQQDPVILQMNNPMGAAKEIKKDTC